MLGTGHHFYDGLAYIIHTTTKIKPNRQVPGGEREARAALRPRRRAREHGEGHRDLAAQGPHGGALKNRAALSLAVGRSVVVVVVVFLLFESTVECGGVGTVGAPMHTAVERLRTVRF